jgi:hypothetical protein
VVPGDFVRIRHFGFPTDGVLKTKLARYRQLLAQPRASPALPSESVQALMLRPLVRVPAGAPSPHRDSGADSPSPHLVPITDTS